MTDRKYKLIRGGWQVSGIEEDSIRRYYRLKALRDIPEHGVKAGDLGGYVNNKKILSHEGSCWIGENAKVVDRVFVTGDAYIGGNALIRCSLTDLKIVIKDHAKIHGDAYIVSHRTVPTQITTIKDSAEIYGSPKIISALEISGNSKIYGNAQLQGARVMGNSEVYDDAILNKGSRIIDTILNGLAEVGEGERLRNGKLDTSGIIGAEGETQKFDTLEEYVKTQQTYIQELEVERNSFASKAFEIETKMPPEATNSENLDFFHEITANIDSYATDIVKIIKYPAMVDPSVPETLAMTVALKKVKRLSRNPENEEFATALAELEEKFILAEAQAFKLASTLLSDDDKKKTRKASDLLRIASNEASSEQEKRVAFIQGFKQLEGVIPVPEIAVDAFRVRIGLPELEA
jgi:carbonic anhydrase/acetyltransferase-like protein (isoleucine patch superfamily)